MLYDDKLISIAEDKIIFKHYYFPSGKPKIVLLDHIEWIKVAEATIRNGKWRIHGSGNFKLWFPRDNKRFKRDKIFFAKLNSQRVRIGFTVEDSGQVEKIFNKMGLTKSGDL